MEVQKVSEMCVLSIIWSMNRLVLGNIIYINNSHTLRFRLSRLFAALYQELGSLQNTLSQYFRHQVKRTEYS